MKHFIPVLTITMLFLMAGLCFGHGDREVAEDQEAVKSTGFWIYNDFDEGFAEAKKTGKPLLVVFR
jgi:hypothetical protein